MKELLLILALSNAVSASAEMKHLALFAGWSYSDVNIYEHAYPCTGDMCDGPEEYSLNGNSLVIGAKYRTLSLSLHTLVATGSNRMSEIYRITFQDNGLNSHRSSFDMWTMEESALEGLWHPKVFSIYHGPLLGGGVSWMKWHDSFAFRSKVEDDNGMTISETSFQAYRHAESALVPHITIGYEWRPYGPFVLQGSAILASYTARLEHATQHSSYEDSWSESLGFEQTRWVLSGLLKLN